MTRVCARPGCGDVAGATFVYDYDTRTTWLDPLAGDRHPMAYDLCPGHADALSVPLGWRLVDRRRPATLDGALAS